MAIRYTSDPDEVDWSQLKSALMADDFCNGRTPDQYRRSAEGCHLNVYVWDEDKIIGNGRVLSDGVCNAYIVDIWTATPYRRQGIGREIVRLLCESVPGQHVYLQTDDAFEFYEACGFARHDFGMGRVIGTWLNRGDL